MYVSLSSVEKVTIVMILQRYFKQINVANFNMKIIEVTNCEKYLKVMYSFKASFDDHFWISYNIHSNLVISFLSLESMNFPDFHLNYV